MRVLCNVMAEENKEKLQKSITINTLFKYDTEYSADSVEWCPHSPYKNYFVCGNYQLAENEGDGIIYLKNAYNTMFFFN